jgi:hypothetical protein
VPAAVDGGRRCRHRCRQTRHSPSQVEGMARRCFCTRSAPPVGAAATAECDAARWCWPNSPAIRSSGPTADGRTPRRRTARADTRTTIEAAFREGEGRGHPH